jgi:two-component system, LytTR family, response regulator LytT
MRILIVEDEKRIAHQLEKQVTQILGKKITRMNVCYTVDSGKDYILNNTIDILFLDLNIHGKDGFSLLKEIVADSFHTIVVSAYTDRAIDAFEYGVLDFIAKPFNRERLEQSISRFNSQAQQSNYYLKYLAIKKHGKITMVSIEEINFIKAAGHYSELYLFNGKKELHSKSLDKLIALLPKNFERVHRSYALDMNRLESIHRYPGSKYELILQDGTVIPCSRIKFKELSTKLQ